MAQLKGLVPKGWGSEYIWASNDQYCGKFLNFEKGGQFSMHFHRDKMETWYVQSGQFEVEVIDTADASVTKKILNPGSTHHNNPLIPHRVTCLEAGTIIEVSTADSVEDNYRILPGDSQP
jgi:quercetin dioxygenase-like cupin family protein